MNPSLTYDEGQRSFELFFSPFFLENSDFIVVNQPILRVLLSFIKLIDEKINWYLCTMEKSLIYIYTNVECV